MLFIAGCGGSPALMTLDAGAVSDDGQGGAITDGPLNVTYGATINRKPSDLAIVGAKVCLVGQPESRCELTDSIGRVRMTVPADSSQAITISAPGFGPSVVAFRAGRVDLIGYTIGLATDSEQRAYYQAAGAEWPSKAGGYLDVFASDISNQSLAGLTMALSPSSGSGALYDNEAGAADPSLKATSSFGTVHFAGITANEVDVTFGPDNLFCSATFGGWPGEKPNAAHIPVVPGFETILGVRCF